jgi:hypothetical protein
MGDEIRGYIRSDRAYYAEANAIKRPEISVGLYGLDGGTAGEFTVMWVESSSASEELIPLIQIYDDAWRALAAMHDLIDELVKHNDRGISDDEFSDILDRLGFRDLTEYRRPEKE